MVDTAISTTRATARAGIGRVPGNCMRGAAEEAVVLEHSGASSLVVEQGLAPWDHPWFVAQGRADYGIRMGQLDAALTRGGPYLTGDAFTLADIPAGFVVHRWYAMRHVERPPLPALDAYYALLSERAAYRRRVRNGLP